jgi:hypothetical protein
VDTLLARFYVVIALVWAIALVLIMLTVYSAGAADKREEFRDKNGFYQGSAVTHGNTTTYRDKNGFYQGTVTRTNPRPKR